MYWCSKPDNSFIYDGGVVDLFEELMLLGFLSLLLTVLQDRIASICITEKVAATWHPCSDKVRDEKIAKTRGGRRLLEFLGSEFGARRSLATKGYDKCAEKVRN